MSCLAEFIFEDVPCGSDGSHGETTPKAHPQSRPPKAHLHGQPWKNTMAWSASSAHAHLLWHTLCQECLQVVMVFMSAIGGSRRGPIFAPLSIGRHARKGSRYSSTASPAYWAGLSQIGAKTSFTIRWSIMCDQGSAAWLIGVKSGQYCEDMKGARCKQWYTEWEKWCQWVV
ncbi:hypothetical protein EDD37DRAFT_292586 [Exophiala viscosa]|uniref:uncharacterized protein n=1 Tax=Exophiala viscosa TaxID=2486360 RepID=UPI002199A22E|nr:hypothetical protein EDD37DRAFT_292586 [Exophiala viscosa]